MVRDDDEALATRAERRDTELLLREDPHLSVRGGELTDPRGIGQGEAHVHERPVAVDEHASLCVARLRVRTGAHDEEAGIRGLGLFRDGKDCLARLLSIPDRGLDRDLEWRGELLQPDPRHVILVPEEQPADRDGRDQQADRDDREVGQEEPAGDAAERSHP